MSNLKERFIDGLVSSALQLGLLRREVVLTVEDTPDQSELAEYGRETPDGRLEILDNAERVIIEGVARVTQLPAPEAVTDEPPRMAA